MVTMSVDSYSLDGYSLTDRNTLGKEKYLLWSSPNILWNAAITRKKYQLVLTTTIGDSKVGTVVICEGIDYWTRCSKCSPDVFWISTAILVQGRYLF